MPILTNNSANLKTIRANNNTLSWYMDMKKPREVVPVDEIRTVYMAITNSDCTEGKGFPVVLCTAFNKTTAIRKGKNRYIQGGDCPVVAATAFRIERDWYSITRIEPPTDKDKAMDALRVEREAAAKKAKSLGLTEREIELLKETK